MAACASAHVGGQLGRILGRVARERHIAAADLKALHCRWRTKANLDKCWLQLGRVVGEFPHMEKIAREAETRVQIGAQHVKASLPNGGPAMFVSGHFSNG